MDTYILESIVTLNSIGIIKVDCSILIVTVTGALILMSFLVYVL